MTTSLSCTVAPWSCHLKTLYYRSDSCSILRRCVYQSRLAQAPLKKQILKHCAKFCASAHGPTRLFSKVQLTCRQIADCPLTVPRIYVPKPLFHQPSYACGPMPHLHMFFQIIILNRLCHQLPRNQQRHHDHSANKQAPKTLMCHNILSVMQHHPH